MCVNFKKIWLVTAINRETEKLIDFFVCDRSSGSCEKLCENVSYLYCIEAKFYTTDKFPEYDIIPKINI